MKIKSSLPQCISIFISLFLFVSFSEAVVKTGNINADETWSGTVEVTGNVTIAAGVTVNVSAGTIVKFSPGTRMNLSGILNAVGTSGSKIYFTSIKDDSVGGDTNGDGNASTPARGDWGRIESLNGDTANITLEHVVIQYGGGGSSAAIYLGSGGCSIDTVTIFDCSSSGITFAGSSVHNYTLNNLTLQKLGGGTGQHGVSVLNGNAFVSSTNLTIVDLGGLYVNLTKGPHTWSSSGSSFSGTGTKAITLSAASWASDVTWDDSVPYYLTGEITLLAGASLTVAPGTTIFGTSAGEIANNGGTLTAIGTAEDPIIFSSIKNDDVAGDTNGDAGATSPAANDWTGISTVLATTKTTLKHCQFSYGGNSQNATIYANGGLLTVEDSSISFSDTRAIYVNAGDVILRNNSISETTATGLWVRNDQGFAILENNHFENCATGVYAFEPGVQMDASGTTAINCGNANAIKVTDTVNTIGEDQIWQEDLLYYLTTDLILAEGVTWTLAPGTRVKVASGKKITVKGEMNAAGSDEQPVQFTSFLDDSIAGDSNEDGGATVPAPGDWVGMQMQTNSLIDFDYVEIYYAGDTTNNAALRFLGYTVFDITNSTIAYSERYGISLSNTPDGRISGNTIRDVGWNGFYSNAGSNSPLVTIANNTFENTGGKGMVYSIDSNFLVSGNTFTGSLNTETIRFRGGRIHAGRTVILEANRTYLFINEGNDFRGGLIEILVGGTLIVEEGAILKFDKFGGIYVDGNLELRGTEVNPVILTSHLDDTNGGDTNGDGNATAPAPGDWFNIWFRDGWTGGKTSGLATGTLENVELHYAGLEYTGSGGTAGPSILLFGGYMEMTDILITDSLDAGFECRYSLGEANINGMTIIDSPAAAIRMLDGTVHLNDITVEEIDGPVLEISLGNLDFSLENLQVGENVPNNSTRVIGGGTQQDTILGHTPLVTVEGRIPLERKSNGTESSITILPGTVVKMGPSLFGTPMVVSDGDRGHWILNGTPGNPIVLTSFLDDSIFGDSNGDGNATVPAPGDWDGVILNNSQSQINNVEVRYAGRTGAGITLGYWQWGPYTYNVSGLHIHDVEGDGLAIQNPLNTDVSNCLIYDFDNYGINAFGDKTGGANFRNITIFGGKTSLFTGYGTYTLANSVLAGATEAAVRRYWSADILISRHNAYYSPDATLGTFYDDSTSASWTPEDSIGDLFADPLFVDAGGDNFIPDTGSPLVDAADGSFADGLDFQGFPRFDDPAVTDTGVGNPSYGDIGAIERLGSSDPTLNPDLTVVDGSVAFIAVGGKFNSLSELMSDPSYSTGQSVEVEYKVMNVGASSALGNWDDALFFSRDTKWDIKDNLAGSTGRPNTLAAGASYTHSIMTTIPNLVDDSYHLIVRTDNGGKQLEFKDYNNSSASSTAYSMDV